MDKGVLLALVLPAAFAGCLGGEPAEPVPTGQIDGAVVDQLLHPFANQTVYLSQLGRTDATSRLGGFTFREVPVGSYTLLTAREGTRGAAAVVDVEADKVTKVILQLLPLPQVLPSMSILPHSSHADFAYANTLCETCSWDIPLAGQHPVEVVFEAHWDQTLLGRDGMRFEVTDDRGDVLYQSPVDLASPVVISIAGADIPDDVQELHVQASFGQEFTPRANFRMESVLTFYYGATKAELFAGE